MTTPWWYSGNDPGDESWDEGVPPSQTPPPAWDPAALVSAANQLVEWATDRFVAPHAEHVNPADHPTCMLCRGSAVLGSVQRSSAPVDGAEPITWVPVRRVDVD